MSRLRTPAAFPLNVAAMFNFAPADEVVRGAVKRADQQKVFILRSGMNGLPRHRLSFSAEVFQSYPQTFNLGSRSRIHQTRRMGRPRNPISSVLNSSEPTMQESIGRARRDGA